MKSLFRKIRHKKIVSSLDIPEGSKILDASCQDGSFLYVMKKMKDNDLELYGIDVSEGSIADAKKLLPDAKFFVSDGVTIPFKDDCFDVVITSMTLHHFENPESSLAEMKRVLKFGGKIYVIDIMYQNPILGFILNLVKCPEPYYFKKFYSKSFATSLIEGLGLRVVRAKSIVIFPATSVCLPITIFEVVSSI